MKFLLREISQGRSNVYLITVCKIQFPHKSLISTLDVGTCDCKITKAHADVVWKPMTRYELHFTVLFRDGPYGFPKKSKKDVAAWIISDAICMLSLP